MKSFTIRLHLILFIGWIVCAAFVGCVAFDPVTQSTVEDLNERPIVAILPFGFDLEITTLSAIKTVDETLSQEDETTHVAETLWEIQREARWLLLSRLATGQGFQFVPAAQTDALAADLDLKPGVIPNPEQLTEFRRRLGADLVVAGSILDYGKIRWQWMLAGMTADMTAESIALGLATAWNPIAIGANLGFELLTSTPLWFGGGYVFGVALRPVRVEARAFETVQGYPIWQAMDQSAYAWGALKTLPEEVRRKKETQLQLNLAEIMESLGDDLIKQGFMASRLREPSALAGLEQH
jgi:hypothetical protein